MKLDVLFICNNADHPNSGYAVRTLSMISTLKDKGFKTGLLRLVPAWHNSPSWKSAMHGFVDVFIERSIPPFVRYASLRKISEIISRNIVDSVVTKYNISTVQCEGHSAVMTIPRRTKRSFRVVTDFHGAASEELLYDNDRRTKWKLHLSKWLKFAEKRALAESEFVFVVSNAMRQYLKEQFEQQTCPIHTVPIGVGAHFFNTISRSEARARLGIKDEIVICYSGGAAPYQCIPEMALIAAKLSKKNSKIRWLVVTNEKERFLKELQISKTEIPLGTVFVAGENRDVPAFLAASDVGLLLRKNNLVNVVSCPTKFGEYLACGLPVISTKYAGHASDFINAFGVGYLTDSAEPDMSGIYDYIINIGTSLRQTCVETAKRELTWDAAGDKVYEHHQSLRRIPI